MNISNYAAFMHLFWQYTQLHSYDFQVFIVVKILILIRDYDIQHMDIHLYDVTNQTTKVYFLNQWIVQAWPDQNAGAPNSLII